MNLSKELENSTNVYRTKFYIVKQVIDVKCDSEMSNALLSHDTYYLRNKSKDKEYEKIFAKKQKIDGKRLPSTMYSRTYVL